MKIGIIGATGRTGSALVQEAQARGHEVTAIVRNRTKAEQQFSAATTILAKDVFALTWDDLKDLDVIINAFASRGDDYQHLDLAAKLVTMTRNQPQPRLFFILGAASLKQADGTTLLASILKAAANEPWVDTPLQQAHEYEYLQWIHNVNWTAISPQRDFVPGPKTSYHLGKDQVMFNSEGQSTVTTGNLASAVLDEIEHPTHPRERFTVVDN